MGKIGLGNATRAQQFRIVAGPLGKIRIVQVGNLHMPIVTAPPQPA